METLPYKFATPEGNGEANVEYWRSRTQGGKKKPPTFVHFKTNSKHTLHKKGTVNRLCNADVRQHR